MYLIVYVNYVSDQLNKLKVYYGYPQCKTGIRN